MIARVSCLSSFALVFVASCGGKVVFDDGAGGSGAGSAVTSSSHASNGVASSAFAAGTTNAVSTGGGTCDLKSQDMNSFECTYQGTCHGQPVSASCTFTPGDEVCKCTNGGGTTIVDCTANPDPCSLDFGCCASFFGPEP